MDLEALPECLCPATAKIPGAMRFRIRGLLDVFSRLIFGFLLGSIPNPLNKDSYRV